MCNHLGSTFLFVLQYYCVLYDPVTYIYFLQVGLHRVLLRGVTRVITTKMVEFS